MSRAMSLALLGVLIGSAAAAAPEKSAAPDNALSIEQVGRLLKEMGCEPKKLSTDVWQVSIVHDGWKVNIMVSASPQGDRLWLESKFAEIPQPEIVPASVWLRLLAENERIGPSYFAFDKSDSRVHLYKSLNNIGLTSTVIKKEIDDFDSVVRKTQRLWRSEAFAARETLSIPPREIENEIKQTSGLDGAWRIVRVESRGNSLTEDMLVDHKPTVIIRGDYATIKTGLEPERKVRIKIDPEQKPKSIDFIDENDRTEAGIYIFETGLLTVCVASAGEERPRQFVTDPKNKLWLLVMKRDE